MKTKIIYISGNETFDMADIRAAFEEVRYTLGLGQDTIMFGVPVDADDAFTATSKAGTLKTNESICITTDENINDESVPANNTNQNIENEPAIAETSVKKVTARKTRTRTKEENKTDIKTNKKSDSDITDTDKKIIPILSILAAQKDENTETDSANVAPANVADEMHNSDIDISADVDTSTDNDFTDQHAIIADKITDDAPEEPIEKTLEQLLESMTPLREDIIEDTTEEEIITEENVSLDDTGNETTEDGTDATLEQLAAEFAENQDKISTPNKNAGHSKIGKLKNILPFKKAKRDDSGLMGDLFGWAGIAANDDDFTIPGFFTNAASKK